MFQHNDPENREGVGINPKLYGKLLNYVKYHKAFNNYLFSGVNIYWWRIRFFLWIIIIMSIGGFIVYDTFKDNESIYRGGCLPDQETNCTMFSILTKVWPIIFPLSILFFYMNRNGREIHGITSELLSANKSYWWRIKFEVVLTLINISYCVYLCYLITQITEDYKLFIAFYSICVIGLIRPMLNYCVILLKYICDKRDYMSSKEIDIMERGYRWNKDDLIKNLYGKVELEPINFYNVYIELYNHVNRCNVATPLVNGYTWSPQNKTGFCSICLENFDDGEKITKLICEHIYHTICIRRFKLTNHKCPDC